MKLVATAFAASLAACTGALAQEYPSEPVTLVIPYAPGGSTDPIGRFLANALQEHWGQPVTVENRPGAGATIGTAHVSQAEPDGHTLLFTTSAYTTAPAVYPSLPYDPEEDLIPVAMPGYSQFLMVAGENVESETLSEFLEEAKTRDIFLATAGLGSSTHFAGELFAARSGVEVTPVHYPGGGDAMVDLIGGRADIYVGSMAAVINNVRNGQIKALAVMGDERAEALPDVESTGENGIEGAETGLWFGVFAPAGTPDEIVDQLNADINEVMATEASKEFMANLEASVRSLSPEEFAEVVSSEIVQWTELADERGIEAN